MASDQHFTYIQSYITELEGDLIIFDYNGKVSQDVTKEYSKKLEDKLTEDGVDTKVIRKIYHAVVESLQNIMRHGHDPVTGEPTFDKDSFGSFAVLQSSTHFSVTTCNAVKNEDVAGISSSLDKINALSEDELKEEYKRMMKEARISEQGGAGLGFVDMVKKTKNPMKYHIKPLNDKSSLILLTATVSVE